MKFRRVGYKLITGKQIGAIVGSFDGVDSDALLLKLGAKEAKAILTLLSELDNAAEQFIHAHYEQQTFPHDDLGRRLNNIVTTAARLLKLLKSDSRTKRQLGHIGTSAGRLHYLLTFKISDSIELESILNAGHTGEKEKAQRESFKGDLSPLIAEVKLLSEANSWNTEIPDISRHLCLLKRVASHAGTVQETQKAKSKIRHKGDQALSELLAGIHQSSTLDFQPSSLRHRNGGTIEAEAIQIRTGCY